MLTTLDEIKRHLQPGFTEQQTDLLATCIYESYEPLVTKREMNEIRSILKDIVVVQNQTDERLREIAVIHERTDKRMEELTEVQKQAGVLMGQLSEAQQRTELRMEQLTEAQQRTEVRMGQLTEAQQRTEIRIEQLTEAQQRTELRVGQLTEAQQRTEVRVGQLTEAQQRTDMRIERLTASHEEIRDELKDLVRVTKDLVWGQNDLRKQVGGIALSVGQGFEAYAMERIPTLLEKQFGFTTRSAMPEILGPPGDQSGIDVVYRGTQAGRPVVVLCEAKTNITETEVREFLQTVDRVRSAAGEGEVRVLFFGYRAGDNARRLIAEYGGWLAFPRGLAIS